MVPNVCRKTHESLYWRSHQKRVLYGKKIIGKSRTKLSASLGDFRQQSFARPKFFLLLHLCPRGWPKICLQGGQKWQNFIFTTRSKENHFFCKKIDGKMSNLKIFGGLALPSDAHAPKSFYNK